MRILLFLLLTSYVLAQSKTMQQLGIDTSKASISIHEVLSGGPPPQGIPALGFTGDHTGAVTASPEVKLILQHQANWLADEEPVIVISLEGESRIYPLQILTWHEIINDTLGNVPIAVTFCPLCNSALAFDRRVPLNEEGLEQLSSINPNAKIISLPEAFLKAYQSQKATKVTKAIEVTFGVSGMLYNSNMLMFDSSSSTLWSQLVGDAVVGTLTGTKLLRYPAPIVSFAEAKTSFPEAKVISKETGFNRPYGSNPYVGYDNIGSPAFLFEGITDGRLSPKERVITLEINGESVAYPFSELRELKVINDTVSEEPITVFWQEGTRSALDQDSIADSQDVGAANVFKRSVNDRVLTFEWNGAGFVDKETSSVWSLFGLAISGELQGTQLTPVVHDNTLWFAWAAFKPETRIFIDE
jgi:hypothetical protein